MQIFVWEMLSPEIQSQFLQPPVGTGKTLQPALREEPALRAPFSRLQVARAGGQRGQA